MIKSRQFTKGQKFFLIMAVFVCGLLFYANAVAFNLISASVYVGEIIAYSALTVAVTLTMITLTIVIRDKRRILLARTQKLKVDSVVKLDQESDAESTLAIAQVEAEKVDADDLVIENIQVSGEVATSDIPAAKISKRRRLFAVIIAIVVGLLVYVNIVAFGLFDLPIFSMYVAAVFAAGLIGVASVVALKKKRSGASARIQKASVVSSFEKSNEPLETVPSSVDLQESTSVVDTSVPDIQAPKGSYETQVSALPKAKSNKRRIVLIFLIASAVGLLFFANAVAFGLISLAGYTAYAFVAVASVLTIITVAMIIVDKRRGRLSKVPIVEVVGAIKESNEAPETSDIVTSPTIGQTSVDKVQSDIVATETARQQEESQAPIVAPVNVFGKQSLFIILIVFTAGLLVFANVVAFDLISLPQYFIYAAVAGAVTLAAVALTMILGEKIKVLGAIIKRFAAEPLIPEIASEVKEPDNVPDIISGPVIAQTSIKKVNTYDELFRQFGIENATNKLGAYLAEQQKPLHKKPEILSTKVICPACRKEFTLPIYERNYIVDFGRPKRSNIIKQCPNCQTSIPLKHKYAVEEDEIWKK